MLLSALLAALGVAALSLVGVAFFGDSKRLIGAERYVVPAAVGVFLSLVLFELIPETLEAAPTWGGVVVAVGFILFYVLANILHNRYHYLEEEECDRRGAAILVLVGDAVHNAADGIILGGAFLIDPSVGAATAIGLALHEVPQEIVEFGVLIRAGYSRARAVLYNFFSASSIILGVLVIVLIAEHGAAYVWVLTGIAAGNLLFLAASELLPRIHSNLPHYHSIWHATLSLVVGFTLMTSVLFFSHEYVEHEEFGTDSGDNTSNSI